MRIVIIILMRIVIIIIEYFYFPSLTCLLAIWKGKALAR